MSRRSDVIETPLSQRIDDFKRRQLPLAIWAVCAAICGWMLLERTYRTEYVGLAESIQYEISAPSVGRVDTVFVDLFEPVGIGDIVAKLDDQELSARIERAHASIRVLRAELIASRSRLESSNDQDIAGWTTDLRRFQTDEEERRLDGLDLKATIEADEIELERLNLKLRRVEPLADEGVVDPLLYDEVRLERNSVRTRLEENKSLLEQTEAEYRSARTRRYEFEANLPQLPEAEPFLGPLRESINVEAQRLREIETRRENLVLRSPVEGQVTSILCRRGQSVVPGEPILTVTDRSVRNIVTYLTQAEERPIRQQTPVLVSSLDRPGGITESYVTRVGSSVEVLPQRLWNDPSVPSYGRAVVIAALPNMGLRPGELLSVRFLED